MNVASPVVLGERADTRPLTEGPVLRVTGATKRFGTVTALDDVSITVERDEILVLLGASGCGKTTLLRCIAGLIDLDGGDVHIGNHSVVALSPGGRDIGMVFQDGALFPHLTAAQNIAVGLRKSGNRAAVTAAAELLRIDHLLARRINQLSGGERQRVGIARALVRRPTLMLMDEPFASLDADLRLELRRELRRLHRLGELAETIFVTHDQTEALGIADRIAVMEHGRVVQQGTPIQLLEAPASLPVARFLGVPRITVLPERNGVILAVRPTDLHAGTGNLAASVRVVAAEPFAGGWLASGRLGNGVDLEFVVSWNDRPAFAQNVVVSCDTARLHAFDARTEARIDISPEELAIVWRAVVDEGDPHR